MEHFDLQPVLGAALPDVAEFLHRWRINDAEGSSSPDYAAENPASIERRLRWLMLENPSARQGSALGYCLRNDAGTIKGLTLAFPAAFLAGDKRLLALCSGSFFVEPLARSMGFYLFRKYLCSPGYSFFFATTCNASSAALWAHQGGTAVPKSEREYCLPLRLGVVIPAILASKTSSPLAARVAESCGRCVDPLIRLLTRASGSLKVEPCDDWEKLSALACLHRPANYITTDRSPEFLRWRYGPASPLFPCGIYLFQDERGNEGWFSLGRLIRGERDQIRASALLDAIWPRDKMSFKSILREVVRLSAASADAIFFRSQPGLNYREYSPWVISRKLAAPRTYVVTPKNAPPLPLDSLDAGDTDDVAWKFHWTDASEQGNPAGQVSEGKAFSSRPARRGGETVPGL